MILLRLQIKSALNKIQEQIQYKVNSLKMITNTQYHKNKIKI